MQQAHKSHTDAVTQSRKIIEQIQKTQQSLNATNQALRAKNQLAETLEREQSKLQTERDRVVVAASAVESKISSLEQSVIATRDQLQTKEREYELLQASIIDLKSQHATEIQSLNREIEQLRAKIELITAEKNATGKYSQLAGDPAQRWNKCLTC